MAVFPRRLVLTRRSLSITSWMTTPCIPLTAREIRCFAHAPKVRLAQVASCAKEPPAMAMRFRPLSALGYPMVTLHRGVVYTWPVVKLWPQRARRRFMLYSPRSPTAKTNGSSREGNEITNPHSRNPKSTNNMTSKQSNNKGGT